MKKSIGQLKRYKKFLNNRIAQITAEKKAMIKIGCRFGGDIESSFYEEYIGAAGDAVGLLSNEIAIASLSTSVKYNSDEMSVKQASSCLDVLRRRRESYVDFLNEMIDGVQSPSSIPLTDVMLSIEKYSKSIKKIDEEIYNLLDKIKKAEEETFVDVDMGGLTVILE